MKLLYYLLIFVMLLTSCAKNESCESLYGNGRYLGGFPLDSNKRTWFVKNVTDSMFFTNSNGVESYFIPYHYKLNAFYTRLLQIRKKTMPCQTEEYDECTVSYDEISYCSELAGLNFFIQRSINIPISYPDTFDNSDLYALSNEAIKIYLPRDNLFKLNLNNDTIVRLVSGIKLINKTLNNVYLLDNEYTNSSLFINKMYYSKGIGIVGFTMSNGEIWERNF